MPLNVLLADPDPYCRAAVVPLLTTLGATVACADSEEEAYRRYLETGHDLLLVDLLLPRRGGLPLLQQIRRLRLGHQVPAVITGTIPQHAALRRQAFDQLGARDYLQKPFAADTLRTKLEQALRTCQPPPAAVANPFPQRKPPPSGSLGPTRSPLLLHQLAAHRVTGCLTLSRGRKKKVVYFRDGEIHFAVSNQLRETLSSHLLAQGRIDPDTVQAAVEKMRREQMKLGEYLILNDILSAQEVFAAIRANVRDKVLDLFRWADGEFQVAAYRQPPAALPGSTLSTATVLWDGVQQILPLRRIQQQLAPLAELLLETREMGSKTDLDPLLQDVDVSLLRTLRRAAGTPLHRVLAELPDEPALRAFYYLLLRGHLVFRGEEALAHADPALETRIRQVSKTLQRLRRSNSFQVLGVPLGADDSTVREAFRRQAKQVHPDTLAPDDPPALGHLYAETFQRIRSAHDDLKNAQRRTRYLAYLQGAEEQATAQAGNAVMQAEVHYQEAQRFGKQRNWAAAAELYRKATQLVPDEGAYLLGLGVALLRQGGAERPHPLREAEQLLGRARQLLPKSADPCYYLGRIALLRADPAGASQHFRSALSRNGNHLEAQRELRLLRLRRGADLDA